MNGAPSPEPPDAAEARDAWLREALRHAPDAGIAPPAELRRAILEQARTKAASENAARRSDGPLAVLGGWWIALARPPVAAGLASLMVSSVVGMLWWSGSFDEAARLDPRVEAAPAPAAAQAVPADAATPASPPSTASDGPPLPMAAAEGPAEPAVAATAKRPVVDAKARSPVRAARSAPAPAPSAAAVAPPPAPEPPTPASTRDEPLAEAPAAATDRESDARRAELAAAEASADLRAALSARAPPETRALGQASNAMRSRADAPSPAQADARLRALVTRLPMQAPTLRWTWAGRPHPHGPAQQAWLERVREATQGRWQRVPPERSDGASVELSDGPDRRAEFIVTPHSVIWTDPALGSWRAPLDASEAAALTALGEAW